MTGNNALMLGFPLCLTTRALRMGWVDGWMGNGVGHGITLDLAYGGITRGLEQVFEWLFLNRCWR